MSAIGSLGNAVLMLGFGFLRGPAGFLTGQLLVGLFALLMWRSEHLALFGLGYFLLGGYRLSRSMVLAYARSFVKPGEIGFAFGLVETGNAVSVILAPIVAGLLYSRNPELTYITGMAAIVFVLVINFFLLPKHNPAQIQVIQANSTAGESDAP